MSEIAAIVERSHPQKAAYLAILGYIAAYIVLDRVSFIAPVRPFDITAWNPPPGLSVAFLVIFGLRYWPALLVSAFLAEILVRSMPAPFLYTLINTMVVAAGYTTIATILKRRLRRRMHFRTLRNLGWFIAITVTATLPVACCYVAVLTFAGMLPLSNFVFNTATFWMGDAIGVTITTPALLAAWRFFAAGQRQLRITREMLCQGAALVATVIVVFGLPNTDEFKFFYLLFVPLIWIAVKNGFTGALAAIVFIQLALIGWAYLFHEESVTLLELQGLMLTLALAGQFLGMAVTEGREAQTTLREREEELQEALRLASASEMYSAIAHELNQPLAALSHFAWASRKIAEKSGLGKKQLVETLDNAIAEAHRAGKVTQRLKELYLGGVVRKEWVNLGALIKASVASLSSKLTQRDILLRFDLPDRPVALAVDPLQITAVLHNIVSNGIDALTSKRESVVRIRREVILTIFVDQDMAVVAIDDNGPGIAPEMRDRVFAAFATNKAKGLGLGLAICRTIIEAHNGRIWVESSRLGGARFCFCLPLRNI